VLTQLAWEWPARWWRAPGDRDYATHLSSADLLRVALGRLGLPAALAF
jgi:hypothetical protein